MRGSDPQAPVVGVYLPLAGGTMVGNIQMGLTILQTSDCQIRQTGADRIAMEALGGGLTRRFHSGYFRVDTAMEFGVDATSLEGNNADNNYFRILARDSGVGLVEVARVQGAADPYFQATLPMRLLPVATASLPGAPVEGMITYNDTIKRLTYRDNTSWREVLPYTLIRKTADEAVNNSVVMQNDDHLIIPIAANEVWQAEYFLHVLQGAWAAVDFKYNFTIPAAATLTYKAHDAIDSAGTLAGSMIIVAATDLVAAVGNGISSLIHAKIVVVNGANAGNITLQWAQNAAAAVNTKLLANSYLIAHKMG